MKLLAAPKKSKIMLDFDTTHLCVGSEDYFMQDEQKKKWILLMATYEKMPRNQTVDARISCIMYTHGQKKENCLPHLKMQ